MINSRWVSTTSQNDTRMRSNPILNFEISSARCVRNSMSILCSVFYRWHSLKEYLGRAGLRRLLSSAGNGRSWHLCQNQASEWRDHAGQWYFADLSPKGKESNQQVKVNKIRNDVIRAMEKTYILGNASVIDNNYICTVPIELNNNLTVLLELGTKYGFISAKLLAKEKHWTK